MAPGLSRGATSSVPGADSGPHCPPPARTDREPDLPRVYRRTLGSRLLATSGIALFGVLCLHTIADPPERGAARGLVVCGALLALSLALAVGNFGDRIEVDLPGIRLRNVWRERLGLDKPRLLRWEEMQEVRALRSGRWALAGPASPAFLVRTRGGRRYVFDSIERIEEIEALVRERLETAA